MKTQNYRNIQQQSFQVLGHLSYFSQSRFPRDILDFEQIIR